MNQYLDITEEIKIALRQKKPIVALESTIISHGMPYPQNVKMAQECENIIRKNGAIPATIAIMHGKIKIGLSEDDLHQLATNNDVMKVSRRDLAEVLATKKIGATTVAATMLCASMAGIKFFVTGGIGGVHRGYEKTMDVSADLEELAVTDVNVICAGAKSILDLPRTLEYLETKGVSVIGYQTKVLPQFFTRESEYELSSSYDTVEEIANIIRVKNDLNLHGGVLIVNPIPEAYSMDKVYIDSLIQKALISAEKDHVHGKKVTPYLLAKIVEESGSKSLTANIQLVYNNARVGALLAKNYYNNIVSK